MSSKDWANTLMTKPQTEEEPQVTRYWLTFYTESGVCDLCRNRGYICSLAAHRPYQYCICPNGQQMRIAGVKLP